MRNNFFYVDKTLMQTPKSGRCYVDYYWVTTKRDQLIFFDLGGNDYSPQSNSNEFVTASIIEKLYPDCTVTKIPIVFCSNLTTEIVNKCRGNTIFIREAEKIYDLYEQGEPIERICYQLNDGLKNFMISDDWSPLSDHDKIYLSMYQHDPIVR